MRRIVIGDVHGCIDELKELLDKVSPVDGDIIVFVGDLLDKGPDSAGVVRFCRTLGDSGINVVAVKGNHEDKHERWRSHIENFHRTGRQNPMQDKTGDLTQITPTLSKDDIAFLEMMPLFYRLPGDVGIVVHAGLSPRLRSLPEIAPSRAGRDDILNTCLWLRNISPTGLAIGLGKETSEDTYWADSYDGKFGHVYFGHQPFKENVPHEFKYATGLDLGCVYGNRLAAAIVADDGSHECITVKARQKYAISYFEGLPGFLSFADV